MTTYVINSLVFEANCCQECNLVENNMAMYTHLLILQSLGKSMIFSLEIYRIVTSVESEMLPMISLETLLVWDFVDIHLSTHQKSNV